MQMALVAKTITLDCPACPTSWSGVLEDGRHWRARYRWGVLRFSVDVDANNLSVFSKTEPEIREEFHLGDEWDGALDYDTMQNTLAELIDLRAANKVELEDTEE